MIDCEPASAGKAEGAVEGTALVDALSATLARYAQDSPVDEAARPLLDYVASRHPGFCVVLMWPAHHTHDLEIAGGDVLDESERDRVLAAVRAWWRRPVRHALQFDPLDLEPGARQGHIAGLHITDDHRSGALALLPGANGPALDAPFSDPALQTATRVLALLLQQRAASAALVQERAVLRSILDMAPDAIVQIDLEGTIKTFNRAAERIFGYAASEAIDQPVSLLMTEADAPHHQGYVHRYVTSGERRLENWRRRFTARCRNGATLPVEIAVGDVNLLGERAFIGVIRDVSDRIRDEERQDSLRTALEHATQLSALGEMAATIAHEVNQPLTAVGNYLDAALTMLDSGAAPEAVRATLKKARVQARSGGEIVRRVRRLTTRREPERSVTDINEAVDEALGYLEKVAAANGVTLHRAYADPAPVANVDRIQFQQVVANVVRNAIQATKGRQDASVTVRTQTDSGSLRVSVLDTGPGLAPEARERVFQSFVTGSKDGVGLGLAISRTIVNAHGGAIWADDNQVGGPGGGPGGGAAFHITLPLTPTPKSTDE